MTDTKRAWFGVLVLFGVLLSSAPGWVDARYIGADRKPFCISCPTNGCSTCKSEKCGDISVQGSSMGFGSTNGTQRTCAACNCGGSGLSFAPTYNSDNADGSRAQIDVGLGYGWTHNHGQLLFSQRGSMFLLDGCGQITRFRRSGRTSYSAGTGYYQTLTRNPDGSFTLKHLDDTTSEFERIPGDTQSVKGPVYKITSLTERNERVFEYDYDTDGRLSKVRDTAFGDSLTFGYRADGHLESVTDDKTGRTRNLEYDSTGRKLLKIIDPPAETGGPRNAMQYSYNARYQQTSITDRDGNRYTVVFSNLKPVGIRDSSGQQLLGLSNPVNWAIDETTLAREQIRQFIPSTTTHTDANGNQWRYTYDANGYITKTVAPDGATTSTTFDPVSLQPATETDANGNTTTYTYDANGNIDTETDAKGNVTDYVHANPSCPDQPTRILYPNGSVTTYEYDTSLDANGLPRCNRTKETRDLGGLNLITEWEYDNLGQMTLERDPNGHETQYAYDSDGNLIRTEDAEGNLTRYAYDAADNQTCMVDGNGHVSVTEYDGLNRVTAEIAKIGTVVGPADPIAPACTTADSDDIITAEYTYDANDNQILVRRQSNTSTPREWQVTSFAYDDRNRLIRETQDPSAEPLNPNPSPLNLVTAYAYDANDNRVRATDPNGNDTRYAYDVQNRLIKVTDALLNETETIYDPVGNPICEIDANDHHTVFVYDELNRLTSQVRKMGDQNCAPADADDLVTQHFYDTGATMACFVDLGSPNCAGPMPGSSSIAYSIDPELRHTHYKYDKVERRWVTIRKVDPFIDTNGICDADDWCEYVAYDDADNVVAQLDANGNRTDMAYLDNDWLLSETQDPGGLELITSYTYDGVGNVKTVTNPRTNVVTNSYDERDHLIQVGDFIGRVASYAYDGIGNRLEDCDGNDNCTAYVFDSVNRIITMVDPMGAPTDQAYDANGNLTATTDRKAQVTCHHYDAINRRTMTVEKVGDSDCDLIDADDIWTQTDYDPVGNVIALGTARLAEPSACAAATPPDDCQTTSYVYDAADRLECEIYADQTTRCFVYDKVGNLIQRTDQLGQVTNYSYSDLYYLLQRDYQDAAEPDDSFTYDVAGRMESATRDGWVVNFDAYDAVNRLLQTTQDFAGTPMVVAYGYDSVAGLRDITYPGGRVCVEQMDLRGRLDDVTCDSFSAQYAYDLGNRVETRTYNNGVTATYGYNANNWITSLVHSNGVADFGYDYDAEGNKLYEDKAHDPTRSEAYAYDDVDRLIDYKVGTLVGSTVPVPSTQRQYDLDKVGNWDQFSIDGVVFNNTPNQMNEYDDWSTNGPGEIPDDLGLDINFADPLPTPPENGENWAHDKNGNRREDGKRLYEYDDENRLIRVERKSDGFVTNYQYDALGRRVVKTVDPLSTPDVTRFAYDDARAIEEHDGLATTLATYVYGNYIDEVLNMQRGGADYYYHQNALWSVIAASDAAGNPVERYAYTDYGCPTITDGAGVAVPPNAWGTAHSAIGNPYMFTGRRWDEESGLYYYRARYYDCEGGRFMTRDQLGYIEGANLYAYVSSNPSNRADPYGLFLVVVDNGFTDLSHPCPGGVAGARCGNYAWENTFDLYNFAVGRLIPSGEVWVPFIGRVQWGVWLQYVSYTWSCSRCGDLNQTNRRGRFWEWWNLGGRRGAPNRNPWVFPVSLFGRPLFQINYYGRDFHRQSYPGCNCTCSETTRVSSYEGLVASGSPFWPFAPSHQDWFGILVMGNEEPVGPGQLNVGTTPSGWGVPYLSKHDWGYSINCADATCKDVHKFGLF